MDFTLSEDEFWQKRPKDSHDDWGGNRTFLESYRDSVNHPHRKLILDYLKDKDFDFLLEVGCCNAPNLKLIRTKYSNVNLAGQDINKEAIDNARKWVGGSHFQVCKLPDIYASDKSYDYVLADACLMYVKDINKALSEMKRVARKGVIIFDWETDNEEKVSYSYTRNWISRLTEAGFKEINIRSLTEQEWPNEKWQKYGRFITAVVA